MKQSSSMPFLTRITSSFSGINNSLREPMLRRRTTTDRVFVDMSNSPLLDLAPVALPGVTSRISRNSTFSISLDELGEAFSQAPDPDAVVIVEGGLTPSLLAAASLAAVCSWNYGFMLGSMNSSSASMRRSLGIAEDAAAQDMAWGLCVSIFCLGALLGCGSAATAANGLGRRRALLLTSAVCSFGALCEAASSLPDCQPSYTNDCTTSLGVALMLMGRAVSGLASGATTVVVPTYLGELAPPHLRGTLGVLFQLACVCALLCAQVLGLPSLMGTVQLWPLYVIGGVCLPSAIQLLLQSYMPESPQWLVGRGAAEAQEAERVLMALRGVDDTFDSDMRDGVEKELDHMQLAAMSSRGHSARGGSSGLAALLRDSDLRPSVVVAVTCAMVQQFSGINNAFNFSTAFLSANGTPPETVTLVAVLMNVGNVLITVLSGWLMDKAGRRALLLASTAGMCAAIVWLSFALTHPGHWWSALSATGSVVTFVAAFGVGMGPVPWLLPAELFPADKVAVGSAFAASCNWAANFVCGLAFLPVASALGGLCFVPFLLVLLPFGAFVAMRVPETRGKSVQQILSELRAHA